MILRVQIGLLLLIAALVAHAHAHSWYDGNCCNEQDCYQTGLGEVERHDDGWFIVPTGETIAFNDARIKRSLDVLIHRCVINTWKGTEKLPREQSNTRCLYVPEVPV